MTRRTAVLLLPLLAVVVACPTKVVPPPPTPAFSVVRSTEELVREMRSRYDGKWYRTLTFVQRNTRIIPSGTDTSTWYEAMRVPGALRIDIAPLAQRNGVLFVRDSQFIVGGGQVTRSIASIHPLMVLGFDVYADPPERTLERLRALGFDLTRLREDSWQGRPAYVVGASAGDLRTRQFWIDRERLVFVRLLQPDRDTTKTAEIRFDKYQPLAGGWIAPEVVFLTDGKPNFIERYEDLRVDAPLPDATFDPRAWNTVPHWHGSK